MDTRAHLAALSTATGLSGYEQAVRDLVRTAWEPLVDEIRSDALGNLIAVKRGTQTDGPRRALMLAAHSDEIGLMVTGTKEGFVRFTTVGGIDLRTIVGQEVVVHGRRELPGIIATRPPHVLSAEDRSKAIPIKDLYVDVGMTADEIDDWVRVGDLISMRVPFTELSGSFVAGKAFDDRTGVAALSVCLETLQSLAHRWDVYLVATSQEEVGLRGALVSAYGLAPDIAIAIDVTFGAQQGVSERQSVKMDGGPAIGLGQNIHPAVLAGLKKVAAAYELKNQIEVIPGASGTDGWAVQVSRDGIPTGLVSIPLRYMHTVVETVSIADVERTGKLLAWYAADLREDICSEIYALGDDES